MKKLTSFEFVHTIVSHEKSRGEYRIEAAKIFHLVDEMESHNVVCRLGLSSFQDLEERYPNDVIVFRKEVKLTNLPKLKASLDNQLRYFKDDELDKLVWQAWQKR